MTEENHSPDPTIMELEGDVGALDRVWETLSNEGLHRQYQIPDSHPIVFI